MDYFQGVVTEYLRADRGVFVNTEYLIQLESGDVPRKGRHWYCDVVAINARESKIYLCEVTYSSTMQSLVTRLKAWESHWPDVCAAIARDSGIPPSWDIQPWLFIPECRNALLTKKLSMLGIDHADSHHMPSPRITFLESVTPWNYRSWDRKSDALECDT